MQIQRRTSKVIKIKMNQYINVDDIFELRNQYIFEKMEQKINQQQIEIFK